MALRKNQPVAEVVEPLVPLVEVAATVSPDYPPAGLPSFAAELADQARQLGMTVLEDWGRRPCLTTTDDAARLYQQLTQPRPAPVDPPRRRRHIPGLTMPDPSVEKAEVH